ncbi:MAG: SufD family Fe-S cluster assembly protein [Bacilli bacterium]|nr:SufD family Fe-S cluster assembly protein [Bacilli bacterium]
MNNIKVNSDYNFLNEENINSLKDNTVYIINENILKNKLVINIPENYHLKFYLIDYQDDYLDITFNQNNNSSIEFMFSITNNKKSTYIITNNVIGSNNKTLIQGRIYNDVKADTNAVINGNIKENTVNNDYTEDIRGLNLYSNNLVIKPNLLVSTSEVVANHMVTIGNFDERKVLYLKEKGISEESIKKLLLNAFLYEIFPKEIFNQDN